MMQKLNKKGFTLVEVMIVLVILGIMASIAVPALTGYMDRQKKKDAIHDCRLVVAAAQSKFMNQYIQNSKKEETRKNAFYRDIESKAGVGGTIKVPDKTTYNSENAVGFETDVNSSNYQKITYLYYESENGYNVRYKLTTKTTANEDKYQIIDDKLYDFDDAQDKVEPSDPGGGGGTDEPDKKTYFGNLEQEVKASHDVFYDLNISVNGQNQQEKLASYMNANKPETIVNADLTILSSASSTEAWYPYVIGKRTGNAVQYYYGMVLFLGTSPDSISTSKYIYFKGYIYYYSGGFTLSELDNLKSEAAIESYLNQKSPTEKFNEQ